MTRSSCTCSNSRVTVHETIVKTHQHHATSAAFTTMLEEDGDVSALDYTSSRSLVSVTAEAVPLGQREKERFPAVKLSPDSIITVPEQTLLPERQPQVPLVHGSHPLHSQSLQTLPEVIATPVEAVQSCCMYEDDVMSRPEFLSATIVRESIHEKFGITFTVEKGPTSTTKRFLDFRRRKLHKKKKERHVRLPHISDLHDKGLLSQAPFCVGDLLVSINKQSCRGMSPEELTDLLSNLTGTITIVVQHPGGDSTLVESFLRKPSPSSKTGVGLMYNPRQNRLKVKQVHYEGLLVDGLLQVEDRIVAINHIPCQHWDAREAVEQIARSPLWVSIVARRHRDSGIVLTVQEGEGSTASTTLSTTHNSINYRTWYTATRSFDARPSFRLLPRGHRTFDSRSRLQLVPRHYHHPPSRTEPILTLPQPQLEEHRRVLDCSASC